MGLTSACRPRCLGRSGRNSRAAPPTCFPTWGESEKISKWVEEDVVTWAIAEIVNAEPDRYPTLYKIINSDEYKAYNKLYTGDENRLCHLFRGRVCGPSFAGVPVYNTAILNEVNEGKTPAVEEFIDFTKACGAAGYVGWWPHNDKLTNWQQIDKTLAAPQGTSILPPTGDVWSGFVPSGEIGTDGEHWTLATVSDEAKEVVKQLAEMYAAGGLDSGIGVKGDFDDAYSDFGAGKIASADFGFGYPGQFRDFYKTAWAAANDGAPMSDLTLGTSLTSDGNYGKTYTTGTWIGAHYFIPTTCETLTACSTWWSIWQAQRDRTCCTTPQITSSATIRALISGSPSTKLTVMTTTAANMSGSATCSSGTEYEVNFCRQRLVDGRVPTPSTTATSGPLKEDAALVDYAAIVSGFVDEAVRRICRRTTICRCPLRPLISARSCRISPTSI